ncbi:hypothetical protein GCK72_014412 [Caenorhabditis remanei]|uniref:Uncharacterized protein n=1 Tax=Caenorhabditis remanei TaxID=31234 RepID=A0A6A5GTF2_CAERE|nr:hypothetical protein GCK72_014412 [Caenorhabditis remanei]KAF1757954.1 hypothetical protein GCK72_014412 [Caenorhabditis remanei]
MVHTFESVLRDSGKQWIIELTYNFNEQETIEDARRITLDAIDNNWKPVTLIPFCAGEGHKEPVLMNPLYQVKQDVETFINYRRALKIYIEQLLQEAIRSEIFDSSELEKVR